MGKKEDIIARVRDKVEKGLAEQRAKRKKRVTGAPKTAAELFQQAFKRAQGKKKRAGKKLSAAQKRALKKAQIAGNRKAKQRARTRTKTIKKVGGYKKVLAIAKRARRAAGLTDSHNPEYVSSVLDHVAKKGDVLMGKALMELSPIYTSTPLGFFAQDVNDSILKTDGVKRSYVDLELLEGEVFVYFKKTAEGRQTTIRRALEKFGDVELLAEPGDEIDEGEQSEWYIFTVKPAEGHLKTYAPSKAVTEAVDEEDVDEGEGDDTFTDEDEAELAELMAGMDDEEIAELQGMLVAGVGMDEE